MRRHYSGFGQQLFFATFFLLSTVAFASRIIAAAGDLDPSFGDGGKVITPLVSGDDVILSVALQSDGKIVGAGWSFNDHDHDFALSRYNSDGSLDQTFGNHGKVITNIGFTEWIESIAIQFDGKIVAAGQGGENGSSNFILARYNTDGTLDDSFGPNGGIVITGIAEGFSGANSVTIQTDGKIVAVGWAYIYPFDYAAHFAILRYNTAGDLDGSFGQNGIVTTDFSQISEASPFTVAVLSDAKIVAAGVVSLPDAYAYALARYNQDGSLDSSFGDGGKVITELDKNRWAVANDIAVQADGKIVAVGYTKDQTRNIFKLAAARYDLAGSLDNTFGTQGISQTLIGERSIATEVVIQPDGKLVEVGSTQDAADNVAFALARYKSNGSLDASFGSNGIVVTPIRGVEDHITAAVIQADGKIVAAGWSKDGAKYDFALARYMGDASAHTRFDFDGDGRSDQCVFRPSETVWYLLGSVTGFAAAPFGLSTDKITPADFDGDGKTDIAVFRDGTWYWINSSNSLFSSYPFGLPDDIPVPADYTGDGHADLAVYRDGDWYTLNLVNGEFQAMAFGISTDKPVPADFDGDSKTDLAVYRDGIWYLSQSTQGFAAVPFGLAPDEPVVGDYDGDSKTDPAVYRAGVWHVLGSTRGFYSVQFGVASDQPVPADYDGDGETDLSVYRHGVWYTLGSQQGFQSVQFGVGDDWPIPAAYLRY